MKTKYLFPEWTVWLGYLLAIPGLILGYFVVYRDFEIAGFGYQMRTQNTMFKNAFENFTNELAIIASVTGLLMIAFSRKKAEDELTAKLRLDALYWAVLVNYLVFFLLIALTNLLNFSALSPIIANNGATAFNLYMPLVIFVCRYHYLLYRNKDKFIVPKLRYLPSKPFRIIGMTISILCILIIPYKEFGEQVVWPRWIMEAMYVAIIPALLFWGYSKKSGEDEAVAQLRLESLQLAVYLNFTLLLLFTLISYGIAFWMLSIWFAFSLLIIFNVIFEIKKCIYMRQVEVSLEKGGVTNEK